MSAAEKIFYNTDLIRYIISYNQCNHCGSAIDADSLALFINFVDSYNLQENKLYTSICKGCAHTIQLSNDHYFG